jgi:hypothetical protein
VSAQIPFRIGMRRQIGEQGDMLSEDNQIEILSVNDRNNTPPGAELFRRYRLGHIAFLNGRTPGSLDVATTPYESRSDMFHCYATLLSVAAVHQAKKQGRC